MEMIYRNVEITEYYPRRAPYFRCYYYEKIGNNDGKLKEISYEEANKLYWELRKLGGKPRYEMNMFDPSISSRQVTYYAPGR